MHEDLNMDDAEQNNSTRRHFFNVIALVFVQLVLAISLEAHRLFSAQGTPPNLLAMIKIDEHPELQNVGGFVLVKKTSEGDILVTRSAEGGYSAMSVLCPHMQCSVKVKSPFLIQCPCHQSAYQIDGTYISGPSKASLRRYPLIVQDGVINILRP